MSFPSHSHPFNLLHHIFPSLSLSPSNPASFLLFYSASSNITLLMSQSFLSTLFILSHSILFPSHSPSSPILFSFTFFSSVYHSITHPFPSSLLTLLLASCPNPSSYYSLLILSLSCIVFIIYASSVFIHLYPYHLLSSSNLLDCSMDWTAQLLLLMVAKGNNGNLICVFECTIVNLATYRQFTNAA